MATVKTKSAGPTVIAATVEMVPVMDLTLHPRNVNEGDIGAITISIRENGFYGSLVVQRSTGYVLAGNHRLLAARQVGLEAVPVMYVDVDDETALRILVADNRTTRLGVDDPNKLAALLQEILEEQGSLVGTGYDGDDLDQILEDLAATEKADEDEAEIPISPELFERHDYVVFYFDNEMDWNQIVERFGIESVVSAKVGNKTVKQPGLARLMPGQRLLDLLGE